jgi:integral membrane sensor domain MASE1
MWTRYEAWPVVATRVAARACAMWSRRSVTVTFGARSRLRSWPAIAVAVFLINSRITVGAWFVSDGFYVRIPPTRISRGERSWASGGERIN